MKRYIITLLTFLSALGINAEEFCIIYEAINLNGEQTNYSLSFRTFEDFPENVELVDCNIYGLQKLEIPAEVVYNGSAYNVVSINTSTPNVEEIIYPSSIRWIKQPIGSWIIRKIKIDNAPIESFPKEWLAWMSDLEIVSFGDACKATEIPDDCFASCHALREIELPASITTIGRNAFSNCSSLNKINLHPAINRIESRAFEDCTSLNTIDLHSGITEINERVFAGCCSLTSVSIPATVNEIGWKAFENCSALENIEFESEEIGTLGSESFANCISIKELCLPKVNFISEKAFSGCTNLKSFTINSKENSSSALEIGNNAFENCSSLKEFNCPPKDISIINSKAFFNCTSLIGVTLCATTYLRDNPFIGCSSLEYIDIENSEQYNEVGVNLYSEDGVLYSTAGCLLIYPCNKIDLEFHVPNNITSIASAAFDGVKNLTRLFIGEDVKRLGVMVFRGGRSLKHVQLPSNLEYIPTGTFMDCLSLESVEIPSTYTYIGTSAFSNCCSLTQLTLPSELMAIGESAFSGCTSMVSAILPFKIKEVRPNTFKDCPSLTKVKLPENLISIQRASFQGCTTLTNIEIPSSVVSIEEHSFKGCESITSVNIPDAVQTLGKSSFEGCSSIKNIIIGNGIKEIEAWSFYECTNLSKITFGSSLEKIGEEAFEGDKKIREITCLSVCPPVYPTGFPSEVVENATVTVPTGCEEDYNSSGTWSPMVEGSDNFSNTIPVEVIQIDYVSVPLEIGDKITLDVVVYPQDATNKSVTWTSSDDNVASVNSNGEVIALSTGHTSITVSANDGSGVSASCLINVIYDANNGVDSFFTDDDACFDVYRFDGTLIYRLCTKEDLKQLSSGCYILKSLSKSYKITIP